MGEGQRRAVRLKEINRLAAVDIEVIPLDAEQVTQLLDIGHRTAGADTAITSGHSAAFGLGEGEGTLQQAGCCRSYRKIQRQSLPVRASLFPVQFCSVSIFLLLLMFQNSEYLNVNRSRELSSLNSPAKSSLASSMSGKEILVSRVSLSRQA